MICRAVLAAVLSTVALLTAAAHAQTVPTDDEIRQVLVRRVDQQKWATGIVVGIVTPDGKHTVAYGTTTKGGRQKVDGDTVYDVGSLTKVFTALALADMAERGEVALDDPAANFLRPGTVLPHDGARQITLADLATHTAGLPLRPDNLVSKNPDNKYAGYTEALLLDFLARYKPAHRIGSTYDYSNVGFGLLGTVLAHCAGTSYADLIDSRIVRPLGLRDTRLDLTPSMQRRLATGYSGELQPLPHWDMGVLESAGGLRSTANDLMIFLDAALGLRKSSLSPAFAALTKTRRPGGMQPATEIALAWNILSDNGREIVWKNGSVGGYRAFMGYDAAHKIGVVALANALTSVGADDIGLHILGSSFPVDTHIPRVHTEAAIDPALLGRYVGQYRYSPTDLVTIVGESGHLFVQLQPGGDKFPLFPEGPRDFFLKLMDAQITFEPGPDGNAVAAIWHQGGQDQRGERVQ
jgi:D-alanyl-D-alanine-carboxypeptidase/D-alanyl-D-alanine-endopeptidase